MVDIELLLISFLRANGDVSAVLGDNIGVEIPEGAGRPFVRLYAAGGTTDAASIPNWLSRPALIVDAWGTTKGSAWSAISVVRDVLSAAPKENPDLDHGVISLVRATYPQYLPDSDWPIDGRPGPRYNMTVRVSAHPR